MTPPRHDTAHYRPVVLPNYAYGFASWHERVTGRPLSPSHRNIIARLEQQRHAATGCGHLSRTTATGMGVRAIIEDPSPATSGIADLLTLYVQWLATRILPHRHPLICDITAAAARRRLLTSPNPATTYKAYLPYSTYRPALKNSALCPLNFALATARRPTQLRGQSCDIALMLNCHAYPRKGPFASRGHDFYLYGVDNFNDLLRTILPMLPPHPESILIIHGRPNRRVTGFQSLRLKSRASIASYTLILPAPIIKRPISLISPIRPISPIIPISILKPLKDLNSLKAFTLAQSPPPAFAKVA